MADHPPDSQEADAAAQESKALQRPGPALTTLLDVPLPVAVELGRVRLTVASVLQLGLGAVLSLEKSASDKVDVLIGGKLVARGDLVLVDGCLGVRITELPERAQPEGRATQAGAEGG